MLQSSSTATVLKQLKRSAQELSEITKILVYLSLSANYPIPFTNTTYWPCISPSTDAPNHDSNCLIFFKHCFYESLFQIKAKSLPPTGMHVPTVAIMFLLIKWSSMFTVLVFWLSDTFTFFAYGILIIVTMVTFKPQFI